MLLKKIYSHFLRLKRIRVASCVLQNGVYKIHNNAFKKIKTFSFLSNYPVFSISKHSSLVSSGLFHFGMYKTTIIGKDLTFYCYKKKKRYLETKKNVSDYGNLLYYHLCKASFVDKKRIMVSPTIIGNQYRDEEHYEKLLDMLFESYSKSFIKYFTFESGNTQKRVPYCAQHGDFHFGNIFWINEEPWFIDFDDVGFYPVFYDLFYFIIRVHKENVDSFLNSPILEERIVQVCKERDLECKKDVVDNYLSYFILHWLKQVDNNMTRNDAQFLFGWINGIELSKFPATSNIVRILKKHLIRNKINIIRV